MINKIIEKGLHNDTYFLACLGSDAKFQEFVRKQPSCISCQFDYNDGKHQCEYQ